MATINNISITFAKQDLYLRGKQVFDSEGKSTLWAVDWHDDTMTIDFCEGGTMDDLKQKIVEETKRFGIADCIFSHEEVSEIPDDDIPTPAVTAKIEVTFPKKVSGIGERDRYELTTFTFEADGTKSGWEQSCDAFNEAVKRGHNPNKNIRMHWVENAPTTPDGEPYDVQIKCPKGRKEPLL